MLVRRPLPALLVLAAACSDQATPEQISTAPVATSAGSLVGSALPTATVEAPIDRSPIAVKVDVDSKSLSVVAYREAPPFMPGAQASPAFRVFPFEKTMIVMQAGNLYELSDGKLLPNPKAVTTEKVPKATPVLGAYEVDRMEGSYPDTLFVQASFQSFLGARQASERTVQYARVAGEWKVREYLPSSVAAWKGGTVLGLASGKLVAETGSPGTLPLQTPGIDGKCAAGTPLVSGRKVAALSSGEVVVFGTRCDDLRPAVEWWPADGLKGTVETLPGAPRDLTPHSIGDHVRIGAKNNAIVAITGPGHKPYLARFDGRAFRQLELPDLGNVNAAWATDDGAAFLVLNELQAKPRKSTLVRILPDGQYTRWRAPQNHSLDTLWARDRDTAYVAWASSSANASVLFGTKADLLTASGAPPAFSEPLPAPEKAKAATGDAPVDGVAAFAKHDDSCREPFVFLYDIASSTPASFPFPATVKTMTAFSKKDGLELVDFKHAGKRRLGVRVPSKDVATELVKHVKSLMPEDDPELVCFKAPADSRTIAF